QRGVAGRRTLVQNVETLAHLALIARYGAAWFRSAGTPDEPGSMLATLHHADGQMGVVETALGTPIADLLPRTAGAGPGGGDPGAWLRAGQAGLLPLTNAALRPFGAAVGAGVLAALPDDRCGLAETARVVRYLTLESAGQCGPCLNGLPRMAGALEELAGPWPHPRGPDDLERWAGLVSGRGGCPHPDGTVPLRPRALPGVAAAVGPPPPGDCPRTRGRTGPSGRPFLPRPAEAPLDDAYWR